MHIGVVTEIESVDGGAGHNDIVVGEQSRLCACAKVGRIVDGVVHIECTCR